MTERDLLRFDSIFDLLIRLGFTEDQKHERMVAPGGTHMVAFAQIGGAENGCPQDEVGRRTHLTKAAKTGWNALTVAQQTACHQLVSAVASAT